MKNQKLQKTIEKLVLNQQLEKAESLLVHYLQENPDDLDGWDRLIVLETIPPFEDYETAAKFAKSALNYHKGNWLYFVLLLFFTDWYLGGLDEELVKKAKEVKNKSNKEISSMISYILAWHEKDEDMNRFKQLLHQAIQEYPNNVSYYADLGKQYLAEGEKELGKQLIQKALMNVQLIYYNDSDIEYDPLDIEHFVNERITGVFITEDSYNTLKDLLHE